MIEVGEARQKFNVHLDLLCKHSTQFEATLQERNIDEAQKSLLLPDVTVDTFNHFLDWLYSGNVLSTFRFTGELKCLNCDDCSGEVPQTERAALLEPFSQEEEQGLEKLPDRVFNLYAEFPLYVFAHQYNVSALRQAIVDQSWRFYRKIRKYSWFGAVIALSRRLPASDPLLRLISDNLISSQPPNHAFCCPNEARLVQKLPSSVLCKVWLGCAMENVELRSLCHYHEHAQDEVTVNSCRDNRKETRKRKRAEFDEDSEGEQA